MKIIYIDVLLALNFFINYYSLLTVSKITRLEKSKFRFIFSSLFASLTSLMIFLPQLNWIISAFIKTIITFMIVIIGYKIEIIKQLFILTAAFFGVSFLFAGSMMFIWLCTASKNIVINNSVVYINISPDIFILSVILVYTVIAFIKRYTSFNNSPEGLTEIVLEYKGNKRSYKSFYDTGLFLKDVFTDSVVIVIDESASLQLSGYDLIALKNKNFVSDLELRIIPCSTINTDGVLYGYKIDRAELKINKTLYVLNPIVVVSNSKLRHGCQVMIGESFYNQCKEKNNVRKDSIKVKSVNQ